MGRLLAVQDMVVDKDRAVNKVVQELRTVQDRAAQLGMAVAGQGKQAAWGKQLHQLDKEVGMKVRLMDWHKLPQNAYFLYDSFLESDCEVVKVLGVRGLYRLATYMLQSGCDRLI